MSWETVPQQRVHKAATKAPVALALSALRNGETRLHLTVDAATAATLGWEAGVRLGLEVGRAGEALGWIRVAPTAEQLDSERQLRSLPKSDWLTIGLEVPDDLARWTAPRNSAEHRLVPRSRMLLAKLPWDLSGEPPATAEAA